MHYAFLGNQPTLAKLELEAVLNSPVSLMTSTIAQVKSGELTNFAKLGGTIKLASKLARTTPAKLEQELVKLITADPAKNIAISSYGVPDFGSDQVRVLKRKVAAERPVRFVSFEVTGHELLMLSKQHVSEYNLLTEGKGLILAKTNWIYDGLAFAKRDRGRPYQDISRGMLPPKLARIMVNLATGGQPMLVYDPYCGTGTVLAEALTLGCHALGSDIDARAVKGAEQNLRWLESLATIPGVTYQLATADVTHPPFTGADCIVTEPFMGPLLDSRQSLPPAKIINLARGLDKLYRGSFRAWSKLLPPGGRVVITLPEFHLPGLVVPTISIDTLSRLGYNYVSSVPYHKLGAVVVRKITVLTKK